MLFGKKPTPKNNQGLAIPIPIPVRIKDPDFLRILESGDAEDFFAQSKVFRETCLELINDHWRLSKAISKHSDIINSPDISEAMQRFVDTLKKHGFLVKDMTGNNIGGLVVDVIHVEKTRDEQIKTAVISETIRPAILFNDRQIQKSEVVVTKPAED